MCGGIFISLLLSPVLGSADVAAAFAKWRQPESGVLLRRGLKLAMMQVLGYKPTTFEVS